MSVVLVTTITREYQFCWDGDFGRVRCGRLANTVSRLRGAGGSMHVTFRCPEHRGRVNDNPLMRMQYTSFVDDTKVFGLGYKP